MSSKRRLRRKACEGKVRYLTHADACTVLSRLNRRELNAYRCPHCGWYHIGHIQAKVRRLKQRMNLTF